LIAYLRGECVLAVAPRWSFAAQGWGDTTLTLPAGTWRNRLTGELVQGGTTNVTKLLAAFPVALLTREDANRETKERSNA
jgi:(1->4)-alpha-D-glucan 1-alpha-D-glucosylmutase